MSSRDQQVQRALEARAQAIADRHRQAEAKLVEMRATIERLRREREETLAEFQALTHPTRPDGDSGPRHPVDADTSRPADASSLQAHDDAEAEPATPPADVASDIGDALADAPSDEAPAGTSPAAPPASDDTLPTMVGEDADVEAAQSPAGGTSTARSRWPMVALVMLAAAGSGAYWLWMRPPASAPSSAVPNGSTALPMQQSAAAPGPSTVPPANANAQQPAGDTEPSSAAPPAASAAGALTAPGTTSSAPPAAATSRLLVELDASRNVWMRLLVDGDTVSNRIVKQGEHLSLEADRLVEVRIGDAGAVRLRVNGEDRGLIGRAGQVLTHRITR